MKFTTRTRSYGDQCEIERACDGGYAYSSNSSKKQCVPRRMTATAHGDAFVHRVHGLRDRARGRVEVALARELQHRDVADARELGDVHPSGLKEDAQARERSEGTRVHTKR